MMQWLFLLLFGGLVFWGFNKLLGKPRSVKPQTFVDQKPRVDNAPRLEELRAKIKLKAEVGQAQTRTVDGVVTTTHSAPAISIPIAIRVPSNSMPVEVGVLTLQTSLIFERDEIFADLNRQATVAKDVKDWPTAIALLRQAKERQGDVYQDTRLALFLQQGGLFDESMTEFNRLLSMVPAQCDASEVSMTPNRRRFCIAHANAVIHNKIRIAAKREKRSDLVMKHHELHSQYQDEADKLRPVIDREWSKARRAYEAKEAQLDKKRQLKIQAAQFGQ